MQTFEENYVVFRNVVVFLYLRQNMLFSCSRYLQEHAGSHCTRICNINAFTLKKHNSFRRCTPNLNRTLIEVLSLYFIRFLTYWNFSLCFRLDRKGVRIQLYYEIIAQQPQISYFRYYKCFNLKSYSNEGYNTWNILTQRYFHQTMFLFS